MRTNSFFVLAVCLIGVLFDVGSEGCAVQPVDQLKGLQLLYPDNKCIQCDAFNVGDVLNNANCGKYGCLSGHRGATCGLVGSAFGLAGKSCASATLTCVPKVFGQQARWAVNTEDNARFAFISDANDVSSVLKMRCTGDSVWQILNNGKNNCDKPQYTLPSGYEVGNFTLHCVSFLKKEAQVTTRTTTLKTTTALATRPARRATIRKNRLAKRPAAKKLVTGDNNNAPCLLANRAPITTTATPCYSPTEALEAVDECTIASDVANAPVRLAATSRPTTTTTTEAPCPYASEAMITNFEIIDTTEAENLDANDAPDATTTDLEASETTEATTTYFDIVDATEATTLQIATKAAKTAVRLSTFRTTHFEAVERLAATNAVTLGTTDVDDLTDATDTETSSAATTMADAFTTRFTESVATVEPIATVELITESTAAAEPVINSATDNILGAVVTNAAPQLLVFNATDNDEYIAVDPANSTNTTLLDFNIDTTTEAMSTVAKQETTITVIVQTTKNENTTTTPAQQIETTMQQDNSLDANSL